MSCGWVAQHSFQLNWPWGKQLAQEASQYHDLWCSKAVLFDSCVSFTVPFCQILFTAQLSESESDPTCRQNLQIPKLIPKKHGEPIFRTDPRKGQELPLPPPLVPQDSGIRSTTPRAKVSLGLGSPWIGDLPIWSVTIFGTFLAHLSHPGLAEPQQLTTEVPLTKACEREREEIWRGDSRSARWYTIETCAPKWQCLWFRHRPIFGELTKCFDQVSFTFQPGCYARPSSLSSLPFFDNCSFDQEYPWNHRIITCLKK